MWNVFNNFKLLIEQFLQILEIVPKIFSNFILEFSDSTEYFLLISTDIRNPSFPNPQILRNALAQN